MKVTKVNITAQMINTYIYLILGGRGGAHTASCSRSSTPRQICL